MGKKICLDTDIVVNFLRNKQKEVDYIQNHESECDVAITLITLFELYYGAYKSEKKEKNLKALQQLLERVTLLNLSPDSVQKAGELLATLEKQGNQIDFRDLFIGTIALTQGYGMKTNNVKDFSRIQGLKIL